MGSTSLLEEGRRAVAERSWGRAHETLTAARRAETLAPEDLWRLAVASYLVGQGRDFLDTLRETYQACIEAGDVLQAVRAAYWLGQYLASRGELAPASGWFRRAARVVDDHGAEGAARGYVLLPVAYRQLMQGDYETSARTSERAADIGRQCRDDDLTALGTHQQGRALVRMGEVERGLALLDEAMIAVTGDELTPVASGLIYCSVISACREVWALRRAREWTDALADWCAKQPDMVAYTGPCRVSRAEILQRRGAWSEAVEEARLAQDLFAAGSGPGSAGPAFYQQGEVHRLRGEYAAAEEAYRAASEAGREPQPGWALLRLAQGEAEAAAASLRRALAETDEARLRARLLPAYIETLLRIGDADAAGDACDELESIASAWGGRPLATVAAQARGAVLLSTGDPEEALAVLRRAAQGWDELDAPYERARTRALLATACERLGDREGAELERAGALSTFDRLGAEPDVARTRRGDGPEGDEVDHGLTPREREVLQWLATGRTNRAIAEGLSISEKTVARHVANIYGKLGLSSRAAATAYAYQHGLARQPT